MVAHSRAALGPVDLRPLNTPRPIAVRVDACGQPRAVRRPGGSEWRQVATVRDHWRLDDEWWREQPIARVYYTLLLDEGTLLSVYDDLVRGCWMEQRA